MLDNGSVRDLGPVESLLSKAANVSEENVAVLTLRLKEMETESDTLKKKEIDLLLALHEKDRQCAADKALVAQWASKYEALQAEYEKITASTVASSSEGVSQLEKECHATEKDTEREAAMVMELGLLKEELRAAALSELLQGQHFEKALVAQKLTQSVEEVGRAATVARICDLEKAIRDGQVAVER